MDVRECLEHQVAEVELLQNMFPCDREFIIEDFLALSNALGCVSGEIPASEIASSISYSIHLQIDPEGGDTLELTFDLPPAYPEVRPNFMVRSRRLSNPAVRRLTSELNAFLRGLAPGQLCAAETVGWLQEHAERIYGPVFDQQQQQPAAGPSGGAGAARDTGLTFSRLWLYSHHIYSKVKRKFLIDSAKELRLSGFSLPGKPGLVCVEGEKAATDAFWQAVRRLTWKRICVKSEETEPADSPEALAALRRFPGFEEKFFPGSNAAPSDRHMDFGALYSFLSGVGLQHIFPLYFGVEGRTAGADD